jgi:hypothetical protein
MFVVAKVNLTIAASRDKFMTSTAKRVIKTQLYGPSIQITLDTNLLGYDEQF